MKTAAPGAHLREESRPAPAFPASYVFCGTAVDLFYKKTAQETLPKSLPNRTDSLASDVIAIQIQARLLRLL